MPLIDLTTEEFTDLKALLVRGVKRWTTSDGRTMEIDLAAVAKVLAEAPVVVDEEESSIPSSGRSTLGSFYRE